MLELFNSLNPASAMVFGAAALLLMAIVAAAAIGITGGAIAKRSRPTTATRIMTLSPQAAIINFSLALVGSLVVYCLLSGAGMALRCLLTTAAMALGYFGLG